MSWLNGKSVGVWDPEIKRRKKRENHDRFGVEDTDEDSDSSDKTNNLGEGMDGGTGNEF